VEHGQAPLDEQYNSESDADHVAVSRLRRVSGLWMIIASSAAIGSTLILLGLLFQGYLQGWWKPLRTEELVVEIFFVVVLLRYGSHLFSGIFFRTSEGEKKTINKEKAYRWNTAGYFVLGVATLVFVIAFIAFVFFDVSVFADLSRILFEPRRF
jgi:hypothetical protein